MILTSSPRNLSRYVETLGAVSTDFVPAVVCTDSGLPGAADGHAAPDSTSWVDHPLGWVSVHAAHGVFAFADAYEAGAGDGEASVLLAVRDGHLESTE